MAYVGNLRQYALGDVLRLIGDGQRRGRIVVERSGLRADIYCEAGCIVHVWRSGSIPPLAQQWLNHRILTTEQLAHLSMLSSTGAANMNDAQLAQLAVDQGMISPELVTNWVLNDAVNLLSVLFSWRDGDYRFEDGMMPGANRLRVALPIATVLNMAVQRVGPLQAPLPTIPVNIDDVLDFAEIDATDAHPIQLSHDQWRVLSLVDGASPLSIIIQQLAALPGISPEDDPQRYTVEYRRAEETVMRVASELVSDGIAVTRNNVPVDLPSTRWS